MQPSAEARAAGASAEPVRGGTATVPVGAFAVAAAALVGWVWWMGRGFGLFSDEWNIAILANRGDFLEPFNGHLSLVPQAVYLALTRSAGLDHYGPYRAVGLAAYVGLAALVGWHAGRRATPVVGAIAGIVVLWSSAGKLTLLFPLLINFTVPAACGCGIWLLLDRADAGIAARRPAVGLLGPVLLAAALASSAVGVVITVAVAVELGVRWWRREVGLATVAPYAVPVALWVAWWVSFHTSTAKPGGFGSLLHFAGTELLASFAALCAGWTPGGWVLLVAFVALVVASVVRWHTFGPRAAGALAAFLTFLALTAIGREGIGANGVPLPRIAPTTDRYLFLNAAFLVSAAAAMAGPVWATRRGPAADRTAGRRARSGLAAGVALAGVAGLLVANGWHLVGDVRTYRHDQLAYQSASRTATVGVRLAGSRARRSRVMPINFVPVTTGGYLDLLRRVGAPPLPHDTSRLGLPADRQRADHTLIADLAIRLRSSTGCPARDAPGAPAPGHPAVAPPGSVLVVRAGVADARVTLRRLAGPEAATTVGAVPAGGTAALSLPAGPGAGLPWVVAATGTGTTITRCG